MAKQVPARNGGTLTRPDKGETMNPKGRPKKLPDLDKLVANLWGEDEEGRQSGIERILKALEAKALKGDTRAIEILLNRTYGLQTQKTELTGRDGSPLAASFVVEVQTDTTPANGDTAPDIGGENTP